MNNNRQNEVPYAQKTNWQSAEREADYQKCTQNHFFDCQGKGAYCPKYPNHMQIN